MEEKDLAVSYTWRNDPLVRKMAMSDNEISYAEHEAMFKWNNSVRLIFEFNGVPSGFLACTKEESSTEGSWSFHLAPEARGKGLAAIMLRLGLIYLKNIGYTTIKSEVKLYNSRSLDLHIDLGFESVQVEDSLADYHNFEKVL